MLQKRLYIAQTTLVKMFSNKSKRIFVYDREKQNTIETLTRIPPISLYQLIQQGSEIVIRIRLPAC